MLPKLYCGSAWLCRRTKHVCLLSSLIYTKQQQCRTQANTCKQLQLADLCLRVALTGHSSACTRGAVLSPDSAVTHHVCDITHVWLVPHIWLVTAVAIHGVCVRHSWERLRKLDTHDLPGQQPQSTCGCFTVLVCHTHPHDTAGVDITKKIAVQRPAGCSSKHL